MVATKTIDDQLQAYLADAHSIEEQALTQLRRAPDIAGNEDLADLLRHHISETERHERLVRERLEAVGSRPSILKEAIMKAGGMGFILFARSQSDTPGKLLSHSYSYEHLEHAAYEVLLAVAQRAGDEETAQVARSIREEEKAMAKRLSGVYDAVVEASLATGRDDIEARLVTYLADAHAIEAQSIQMLEAGPAIAGDEQLAELYRDHLDETRTQQEIIRQRLDAHGATPSKVKDAAMRLGAMNWGTFFGAQPDTPPKLAAFSHALENLEIAGYEQLKRVARRAEDEETVSAVERILQQEHDASDKIFATIPTAVEASLRDRGVEG